MPLQCNPFEPPIPTNPRQVAEAEEGVFQTLTATQYEYETLLGEIRAAIITLVQQIGTVFGQVAMGLSSQVRETLSNTRQVLSQTGSLLSTQVGRNLATNANAIGRMASSNQYVGHVSPVLGQVVQGRTGETSPQYPSISPAGEGQSGYGSVPTSQQILSQSPTAATRTGPKGEALPQREPEKDRLESELRQESERLDRQRFTRQGQAAFPDAVDLPFALAMKFSQLDSQWIGSAVQWSGGWLTRFINSQSMDDYVNKSPIDKLE